jgi:hypothetical protein
MRWLADPPPVLYTYCIPFDDGAAPNPFWGTCTLAICKPVIRRVARVGDWIVGTGSRESPMGDTSGQLVYAMKVTDIMSMSAYDHWTHRQLPAKVPAWRSRDHRRRLGDSIYDFSVDPLRQRRGVHGQENLATDLSGHNVLLSNEFYYFGDHAIALPNHLLPIVKQGQGHRSSSNQPFVSEFSSWLGGLLVAPGVHGQPQLDLFKDADSPRSCAIARSVESEQDELMGDEATRP